MFLGILPLILASFLSFPVFADEKVYLFGIEKNSVPYEFTNDRGVFTGVDVEILKEISNLTHFQYKFEYYDDFYKMLEDLQNGKTDAILNNIYMTDERKKVFDFSDSYYLDGTQLAVMDNSDLRNLADFKGKTIGVVEGTVNEVFLKTKDKEFFEKNKQVILKSNEELYRQLEDGRLDAVYTNAMELSYSKAHGKQIRAISPDLHELPIAMIVKKAEDSALLEKFNDGLERIEENGKLDEIIEKYTTNVTSEDDAIEFKKNNSTNALGGVLILPGIIVLLGFSFGIYFWNRKKGMIPPTE
ncbi:MAG: ABC transporter substrate-binding protein [Streptococcaceae bacterium]|jgi:polar amino acid transport system substrate-binding protein|nr:ABC transporter substrate-binding protein [Streptococcaceae bacterium]